MVIDITASEKPQHPVALDWAGMRGVEIPVKLNDQVLPATADIFVNLHNKDGKGIHMSRLYLTAKKHLEAASLSCETLKKIVTECIDSHEGLSDEAQISVHFQFMRQVKSLVTDNKGWRYYPVTFTARKEADALVFQLEFKLTYSSTCPCSAALSRESLRDHFEQAFTEDNISRENMSEWLMDEKNQAATPHSQRSQATINVEVENFKDMAHLESLIAQGEAALQTAVQTVVKRTDEQRFAELNAANLMFCEDAARTLQNTYDSIDGITDYWIEVAHLESLHAHDAVAVVTKR